MALHTSIKSMGIRLYDVRQYVNLPALRPEFSRLAVDPYVKKGHRQKHILWLNHQVEGRGIGRRSEFYKLDVNHVHGEKKLLIYPRIESWTLEKENFSQLVRVFADIANVPDGSDILVQFQRITCFPGRPGEHSVEDWHKDDIDNIAVLCMDRMNIEGGVSQFINDNECFQTHLVPGTMVLFKDADVLHRVSEIHSEDGHNQGKRDVILIASYK